MSHVYMTGAMLGYSVLRDDGMEFDPNKPYTGCRICGTLFQSALDRLESPDAVQIAESLSFRQSWSLDHADTHTAREHHLLAISGSWCTPEAAAKLAGHGIIAITDMVLSDEHAHSMRLAPRAPSDDVEGLPVGRRH